ncbi:MAG: thiamine diphosphokinase [Patescibacteria group bacterium]
MKQIKTITIIGGGELSEKFISGISGADYVIGVDRGAYWLIKYNIIPDIAIGDFDSVNASELRFIKQKSKRIEEHPQKKDASDMELAVDHAITIGAKEVIIYGAVGDRLDHTLANVHLLERLHDKGVVGVIRDENNEVMVVENVLTIKKEARFRYVSVLAITETIEVSLIGFAYNLTHTIIHRGQTLGISNEIRGNVATINVHRGKALFIRSRD